MSKMKKRLPLPSPELTEKDRAHLAWIKQNSVDLARTARKLYNKSGRGAFLVREQDAKPSGTTARYLSLASAYTIEMGWPDAHTAGLVRTYDPTQQFVIVFVYRDGVASSYTIHFIELGDTFAVEVV